MTQPEGTYGEPVQEPAPQPEPGDAEIAAITDPDNPAQIAYNVERIERVDNHVQMQVAFSVPTTWQGAPAIRVVHNTILIYPDETGEITEQAARIAIEERVETFIKPQYLNALTVIVDDLSAMLGEWGTFE